MAEADRLRLQNRVQADYDGFGYANLFVPDLNAVAAVGNDVAADALAAKGAADTAAADVLAATATNASNAAGSANAAAASLAAAQAITGGAQGVGVGSLMVPRVAELGSAAFADIGGLVRRPIRAITANYTISPDDDLCTLLVESGPVTLTLPLITELPPWWEVRIWNRSGNTATLQRAASAVIGAAATSITIADGAGALLVRRDATRFERIA